MAMLITTANLAWFTILKAALNMAFQQVHVKGSFDYGRELEPY